MGKKFGFTLIEVLIVVFIIASTLGVVLSTINTKKNALQIILKNFTLLHRDLLDRRDLEKQIFRLAFKSEQEDFSYWVERWQNKKFEANDLKGKSLLEIKKLQKEKEFAIDKRFFSEAQNLPKGITFKNIFLENTENPIVQNEEGNIKYLYYAPKRLGAGMLIQIQYKEKTWSLFFPPGFEDLQIFKKEKTLEELL